MTTSPPGPFTQRVNALVHKEPIESLAHGMFWSIFLMLTVPIAVMFLQLRALWNLLSWLFGMTGKGYYDPTRHEATELAVVISGCDSGFGKELAFWAADAGFIVFAGCLKEESFSQFGLSPRITPLKMDVTNDKEIEKVANRVSAWLADPEAKQPRILHALCNIAGIGLGSNLDMSEVSVFEQVMNVNYLGIVRCCKAFLPILKKQAIQRKHLGARILNMASMAGKGDPLPTLTSYSASKHAAVVFSTGLRYEVQPFAIQVSSICPSFHDTPLVRGCRDLIASSWNSLPEETRMEYGEDYRKFLFGFAHLAQKTSWKSEVVVQKMMDGLMSRTVPAEFIIG